MTELESPFKEQLAALLQWIIGMPHFPQACNVSVNYTIGGVYYPWRTNDEYNTLMKSLFDSARSAGKPCSYAILEWDTCGAPMYEYRIGVNRGDNVVMWCSRMHGWEDYGSELIYYIANWLLTDPGALVARILERNFIVFIPVVNSKWGRYNNHYDPWTCIHGVGIDGNFPQDWSWRECPVGDRYPDYRGYKALSEIESQAVFNQIVAYKPAHFVNFHNVGLDISWYDSEWQTARAQEVRDAFYDICAYNSYTPVPPWHLTEAPYEYLPGWASRTSAAYSQGRGTGWTIEVDWSDDDHPNGKHLLHDDTHFSRMQTWVFPPAKWFMQAMCLNCENPHGEPTEAQWHEFHHLGDVNWDGFINITDIARIGTKSGQKGNPEWINEDVVADGVINVYDLACAGRHYGKNIWQYYGL